MVLPLTWTQYGRTAPCGDTAAFAAWGVLASLTGMSDWHALSPTLAADRLAVSLDGFTSAEAVTRLATLGANVLPKPPPPSAWRIWLGQFLNPLVLLLVAAAIVAAIVGDHDDAGFIAVVILINAAIGAVLEIRAALDRQP
jgi:magnesium-transporting ATPase (P-type)